MRKLTLEEANNKLKEKGIEYECIKYLGYHSSESDFIHIPSKKPGKSAYSDILKGGHPSWSPACRNRRDINEAIANERLREANSEYECVKYFGITSPDSEFIHTPTNTGPKKSKFSNILKGWHPSGTPESKAKKKAVYQKFRLTLKQVNDKLENVNSAYRCVKYLKANSPNSKFIHVLSGENGESTYNDILKGSHPSWSPECKSRKDIDEFIVNERLTNANIEYKCIYYDGHVSKNSLFIHIPTNTGPKKSRYDHVLAGTHPSWSPASKCDWPSNDKLCLVYFCKTKTYGNYDKHKNGPYLTIGITVRESAKQRYTGNGHIKTFHEFETYNCNIHERSLLEQITALLGKPEAGNEAWQWSQNREDIIKKLFLDHFLKDYIEPLDTNHSIMP